MHKINTSTATSDNRFTDGVLRTQPNAAWFNAVQGELTNLVEGWNGTIGEPEQEEGNYVLSQTSNNQILKIINQKLSDLRTELQTQITANADNIATNAATPTSGPIGTIVYAATTGNVPGYLKLDGTKHAVTDYPELANWAWNNSGKWYVGNPSGNDIRLNMDLSSQTTYAPTYFLFNGTNLQNSTQFRVPNFRGMFLRVLDEGSGVDPDNTSQLMTYQGDTFKSHNHIVRYPNNSNVITWNFWDVRAGGGNPRLNAFYRLNGGHNRSFTLPVPTINHSGDSETRPKNVSVCAYIKY